ncbi:hypothetical protein AAMO2058_000981500 [Amorphochlora amoebiformis]|eukprot:1162675-Amorphochlora_amoeboformis.AAC.2
MPDKKSSLISKKDDQDTKSEINYCTLCKAAQIPDCGDRTKDNSGWNNAEWGVYASVRRFAVIFPPFITNLLSTQEEERKAAELLRKNAVNLKTLNMQQEEKTTS